MEQPTLTLPTAPKTYHEKLRPAPTQERTLDEVLWRCRTRVNCAGAPPHLVATRARPLPQPPPAGSRVAGSAGDLPGVCGHPQPGPARCARPVGSDLSGVLPARGGGGEGGLPALPGPGVRTGSDLYCVLGGF